MPNILCITADKRITSYIIYFTDLVLLQLIVDIAGHNPNIKNDAKVVARVARIGTARAGKYRIQFIYHTYSIHNIVVVYCIHTVHTDI
jgi:hypothetical protein